MRAPREAATLLPVRQAGGFAGGNRNGLRSGRRQNGDRGPAGAETTSAGVFFVDGNSAVREIERRGPHLFRDFVFFRTGRRGPTRIYVADGDDGRVASRGDCAGDHAPARAHGDRAPLPARADAAYIVLSERNSRRGGIRPEFRGEIEEAGSFTGGTIRERTGRPVSPRAVSRRVPGAGEEADRKQGKGHRGAPSRKGSATGSRGGFDDRAEAEHREQKRAREKPVGGISPVFAQEKNRLGARLSCESIRNRAPGRWQDGIQLPASEP